MEKAIEIGGALVVLYLLFVWLRGSGGAFASPAPRQSYVTRRQLLTQGRVTNWNAWSGREPHPTHNPPTWGRGR